MLGTKDFAGRCHGGAFRKRALHPDETRQELIPPGASRAVAVPVSIPVQDVGYGGPGHPIIVDCAGSPKSGRGRRRCSEHQVEIGVEGRCVRLALMVALLADLLFTPSAIPVSVGAERVNFQLSYLCAGKVEVTTGVKKRGERLR